MNIIKIIFFIVICGFLCLSSTSSMINSIDSSKNTKNENPMVFAEYATATWCPQCPNASETLFDLQSEDSSFSYVTLVVDKNQVAQKRSRDFTNYAIPSVYFDGGYVQYIGSNESLESIYSSFINECKQRTNRNQLSMAGNLSILEDNSIQISIDITNDGKQTYFGKIKTYITLKESQWNDYDGNKYHFSLIDFALNQNILIKKGETKTVESTWNPANKDLNQSSMNISQENIKIYTSVFHWTPHLRFGFIKFPYIQFYFAHYTDQVLSMEL